MKKIIGVMLVSILMISIFISGCQEKKSTTVSENGKVILDSAIVVFNNVSFTKNLDKYGTTESTTVKWLFHNIAGKMISANIFVKFYDKNGIQLYNDTKQLVDVPAGYTEKFLSPANMVTYDGPDVTSVDHVIITVVEM